MNLTKEQVLAGIAAGLALTDPEGDARVPMKFCAGALILRELLIGLGNGSLALVPTMQMPPLPPKPKPKNNGRKARKVKLPPKANRKKK